MEPPKKRNDTPIKPSPCFGRRGTPYFRSIPRSKRIEGVQVYRSLAEIGEPLDTLTLYIGPAAQAGAVEEDILAADLKRVIFNPGTENPGLEKALEEKGVEPFEACTLVMLKTGQF